MTTIWGEYKANLTNLNELPENEKIPQKKKKKTIHNPPTMVYFGKHLRSPPESKLLLSGEWGKMPIVGIADTCDNKFRSC